MGSTPTPSLYAVQMTQPTRHTIKHIKIVSDIILPPMVLTNPLKGVKIMSLTILNVFGWMVYLVAWVICTAYKDRECEDPIELDLTYGVYVVRKKLRGRWVVVDMWKGD